MRPKSDSTKVLQGTARRDRLRRGAPSPPASGRCPKGLPPGAKIHWRKLAPLLRRAGRLGALDVGALADLALCLYRRDQIEQALGREGLSIKGYRDSTVKHPLLAPLKMYRDAIARYESQFGLTPLAREALGAPAADAEEAGDYLDRMSQREEYADLQPPEEYKL